MTDAVSTTRIGDHAVVLGGGMAGLLAARVLAGAYDRVTVVERDAVASAVDPRRGVPQGRHIHGLLGRGQRALDELFDGFTDELTAAGPRSSHGGPGWRRSRASATLSR